MVLRAGLLAGAALLARLETVVAATVAALRTARFTGATGVAFLQTGLAAATVAVGAALLPTIAHMAIGAAFAADASLLALDARRFAAAFIARQHRAVRRFALFAVVGVAFHLLAGCACGDHASWAAVGVFVMKTAGIGTPANHAAETGSRAVAERVVADAARAAPAIRGRGAGNLYTEELTTNTALSRCNPGFGGGCPPGERADQSSHERPPRRSVGERAGYGVEAGPIHKAAPLPFATATLNGAREPDDNKATGDRVARGLPFW